MKTWLLLTGVATAAAFGPSSCPTCSEILDKQTEVNPVLAFNEAAKEKPTDMEAETARLFKWLSESRQCCPERLEELIAAAFGSAGARSPPVQPPTMPLPLSPPCQPSPPLLPPAPPSPPAVPPSPPSPPSAPLPPWAPPSCRTCSEILDKLTEVNLAFKEAAKEKPTDMEAETARLFKWRSESRQCCVEKLEELKLLKASFELGTLWLASVARDLENVKEIMSELEYITDPKKAPGGSTDETDELPFAGYDVRPLLEPDCTEPCLAAAIDAQLEVWLATANLCDYGYEDLLEQCRYTFNDSVKQLRAVLPKIRPYTEFYKATTNIVKIIKAKYDSSIRTHDTMDITVTYLELSTKYCDLTA